MEAESVLSLSRRSEELRYVTEHFRDMQGMTAMPLTVLLFLWIRWDAVQTRACVHVRRWTLLGVFLLGALAGKLVHDWYKRNFGFVGTPGEPRRPLSEAYARLFNGLAWLWIGMLSTPRSGVGHTNALDFLLVVLFFLLPRCRQNTPRSLPLQLRKVLASVATACLLGLIAASLVSGALQWPLLYAISGCVFLLVAYDHWLLTHLLPGAKRGKEAHHG